MKLSSEIQELAVLEEKTFFFQLQLLKDKSKNILNKNSKLKLEDQSDSHC